MSKSNWLAKLKSNRGLQSQLVIGFFFIALILFFLWSLNRYWQNTLQPRLYLTANTQANILAQSQAKVLLETLDRTASQYLVEEVKDVIQEMLIVEDPSIGGRFIKNISLQIDYSNVNIENGALDFSEGEQDCNSCFSVDVPLINREGEILGLATFAISDRYFKLLSAEVKSKLFAETQMTLALVVAVWIIMTIMFHRLHKAKQIVEASDLAKTRFMANVTHELRTPLNAILGYTQLFKNDRELMNIHSQGIETIDKSAEHLLLMINDILEFSRSNEDNLVLHPVEINFIGFLTTLVEMCKVRAKLKHLPFIYNFDPELPSVIVADDKRLRQVLLNLLSNAIKFTQQGEVSFNVQLQSQRHSSATIKFEIVDSGIGIARDQLTNIFIPFHQLDNPITRAEGSGLGLTISQRLISLMGSRLTVESEIGKGSCFAFSIELPVLDSAPICLEIEDHDNEAGPINLPDAVILDNLRQHAKLHNILGIRSQIDELTKDPHYASFVEQIKPYIDNYQFKQLQQWLEKIESST